MSPYQQQLTLFVAKDPYPINSIKMSLTVESEGVQHT